MTSKYILSPGAREEFSTLSRGEWIAKYFPQSTQVLIPITGIDSIIGQQDLKEVFNFVLKGRHLLVVGAPGTGKSLLTGLLSQYAKEVPLTDIVAFPNEDDFSKPILKRIKGGTSKKVLTKVNKFSKLLKSEDPMPVSRHIGTILMVLSILISLMAVIILIFGLVYARYYYKFTNLFFSLSYLSLSLITIGLLLDRLLDLGRKPIEDRSKPHVLYSSNSAFGKPPVIDFTSSNSGRLLGGTYHDPYESGTLSTPHHMRLYAGDIHKAHNGFLRIDEIGTLDLDSQYNLLTVMETKQARITSTARLANIQTNAIPSDFSLILCGNQETIQNIHPAIRSRIKRKGFEIYMNDEMDDTPENRVELLHFMKNEIMKSSTKLDFDNSAIIEFFRYMAANSSPNSFSLSLREAVGVLVRAQEFSHERGSNIVTATDLQRTLRLGADLMTQFYDKNAEKYKKFHREIDYSVPLIGGMWGIGVPGSTGMGSIMRMYVSIVDSNVASRLGISKGQIPPNTEKTMADGMRKVQILFAQLGLDLGERSFYFSSESPNVEGNSATLCFMLCALSAYFNFKIRQDVAMTGAMGPMGEVLPVGGIPGKLKTARFYNMARVLVPAVHIQYPDVLDNMEIIPIRNLIDIVKNAAVDSPERDSAIKYLENNLVL